MIEDQIKEHALKCFPNECVGYVYHGEYYHLKNLSKRPEVEYNLSIDDKIMLSGLGKDLTALVHSHPIMDSTPSEKDLRAQQATNFNFMIIGTDGVNTTDIRRIPYERSNN